jgi:hypothetical protein
MTLIAYLDETGDHSLTSIDPGFPVFLLMLLVTDCSHYAQIIVPSIYQLKMDYWGHEAVILHSRDIRKAQRDFAFLAKAEARKPFYERLNQIIGNSNYSLICSAIRKEQLSDRYGHNANNPYDLALTFALERLLQLLEDCGQKEIKIVAEARGKSEDKQLQLSFLNIINQGTSFFDSSRFRKIKFELLFRSKSMNVVGTQLADLVAYPTARWIINPSADNASFLVFKDKFYKRKGQEIGLKIFP